MSPATAGEGILRAMVPGSGGAGRLRRARGTGRLRGALPVALCALGGHFALYRTLTPASGEHAYFAWYEPLVAGLSALSLAVFAALVATGLVARGELRRRVVGLLLPAAAEAQPLAVRTARLAITSVAFLAVQESAERSLAAGRFAPAAFPAGEILPILAVLVALALSVALVERSCRRLAARVARLAAPRRRPAVWLAPARHRAVRVSRRNPLADLRGLRAPPAPA